MKKTIDYKKLYLEQYKNIPNLYFWGTMISGGAVSIILSIYYFSLATDGYSSYAADGLLALFGGLVATVVLAYVNRWISSIVISQKVVVADTLLAMKDETTTPVVEDELPKKAKNLFEGIDTVKDAVAEIDCYNRRTEELNAEKEKRVQFESEKKKKKKRTICIFSCLTGLCILYWIFQLVIGYSISGYEKIIDLFFAIGVIAFPVVGTMCIVQMDKRK